VPGVTEVLAGLVGSLVGSVLQVDNALSGPQLLLCELTLVLVGLFGSENWSAPLRVNLGRSAESEDALRDLDDVAFLPEVDGLEDVYLGHSVLLAGLLELVDVLHQLELSSSRVDLRDAPWHHLVYQLAENLSVSESIFIWKVGESFSCDGFNPFDNFLLCLGIPLTSDLISNLGA